MMKKQCVAILVLALLTVISACAPAASPTPQAAQPTGPAASPTPQAAQPTVTQSASQVTPQVTPTAPQRPKNLIVGHNIEPATLDPFAHTTAAFQSVTAGAFEQLVMFAANSSDVQPALAESWSWSPDNRSLTFKLKKGVKFHNGEAFNAEAAKFSIEQLMASKPFLVYTKDLNFKSADIVDENTVVMNLTQPIGTLLAVLARGSFVVPPKYYKEVGPEGFSKSPIGTGPYQFVEWIKDNRIAFKSFPGYWGGAPKLATITWQIIPDQTARVAALKAGEVHFASSVVPGQAGQIKADSNLKLVSFPGLRQWATFFDSRMDHPVANAKVRRALNYAVDKQGLVALFEGNAAPLRGQFITPAVLGYNTGVDPFDYNPTKAKQLLSEAGYANGFEMIYKYTVGRYPLDKEMGEAVAGYLEAVGVKVKQTPLEFGEFSRQHSEPSMGPSWQWALLTPPDPHITLGLYSKGSKFNRFPDSPKVNDLLDRGMRETDQTKRQAIYQELVQHWNDDPIGIYLIVTNDLYAVRNEVIGFAPRVDQVIDLNQVDLAR